MRRYYVRLSILVAGGLLLRFYGINFGFHVDEPNVVERALAMAQGQWHQPWYHWPGQSLMFIYALLFKLNTLSTIPLQPYIIARTVSVMASGATIWLVAQCTKLLTQSTRTSLAAATVYAVSYLAVRNGHYATPDAVMTCLLVLLLYCALRLAQAPADQLAHRWYMFGGLVLGVALATKYTAALGIVPFIIVYCFYHRTQWKLLLWFIGALVVAHTLTNPFALVDWRIVLGQLATEANPVRLGVDWSGQPHFWRNLWFYMSGLPEAMGTLFTFAGIVGFAISLWHGWRTKQLSFVLTPLLGIVFLVGLSILGLHWSRWTLPLIPLVAIGVGVTTWKIQQPVVFIIVICLATLPQFIISFMSSYADLQPSTSAHASLWLLQNTSPDVRIVGEVENISLPEPWSYTNKAGQLFTIDSSDYDYIIIKAKDMKYRRAEPEHYALELAWYDQLRSQATLVHKETKPEHTILEKKDDWSVYYWLVQPKHWSRLFTVYQGQPLAIYQHNN